MDKEGVVLLYIYTMDYYSVIKKNEIIPELQQHDEPRHCHTGWSHLDRGQILYGIPYMWNLKINVTNEQI